MQISTARTRRRLVVLAGTLTALRILPARAQSTTLGDCTIGFEKGLLQFNDACSLTLPTLGTGVAPPSHMDLPPVDVAAIEAEIADNEAAAQARKDRQQAARKRKRDARQDRRLQRQLEDDARFAERHRPCFNFATQIEAQTYFDGPDYNSHDDPMGLDTDNDDKACETLPPGTHT
jgi:hypothetical protein